MPRRRPAARRGAAMLEFAIVAPLLVLLLIGIIEYGRFFFLYNALITAVREGARLGAVTPTATPEERTAALDGITAAVRTRIVDPRANDADVVITLPSGSGPDQTIRVVIHAYPFTAILPGLTPAVFPDIPAEFRYELQ